MLFLCNLPKLNRHQRARIQREREQAPEREALDTDAVVNHDTPTADPYGDSAYYSFNSVCSTEDAFDSDDEASDFEGDLLANGLTIVEPEGVLATTRFLNGYDIL